MSVRACRVGVLVAVLVALVPLLAADAPKAKLQDFTGKVVPLADLAKQAGEKLDADAGRTSLALVADDGKVYTLLKDDGSRAFFSDKALLNRPMLLTGRLLPGSQVLQVTVLRSVLKGQPHEVYYWCDVCSIKRGEMMTCECCGGPMELRETPLRP